jgi:hypothetical protein
MACASDHAHAGPFVGVSLAFLAYVQTQSWHQALVVPQISEWRALFESLPAMSSVE